MMMRKKLLALEFKMITLTQLMKLAGNIEYGELVGKINDLIEDNLLEPVKSTGKNGRSPSLFMKYRIIKPKTDYTSALEKIKLLHPKFNHSKYALQPEVYVKHKQEIDLLSKFLWENSKLLDDEMSINERSFQIWGVEKLIKDKSIIKSIFQFNEWDLAMLNYYETPEPFFEYNFSKEKEMNVLIIENKDTWFSLRKTMREDGLNHLFRGYHILVYGEGKKIISRNNRMKEYDQLLSGSRNTYYYFGDLDYEGIDIFQTLVANNQELPIKLCTELYSWMLALAKNYNLPNTKAGQKRVEIQTFLDNFSNAESAEIEKILKSGVYIPQEILNYQLMKSKMREGFED